MTPRSPAPAAPSLLLMTATIAPPAGVPALARVDPVDRLEDYRRALEFYLRLPEATLDRVVLAENSASDLAPLEATVADASGDKDVELLSFDGLDYPPEHGRAVGEMRLIETAFGRSRLLRGLDEDELLWKVTGRLRVTTIERLVATAPADAELYADFRRHPRPWVDLRILACTRRGFRALLLPRVELMRQDEVDRAGYSAPEERLFGELLSERASHRIVPRLRVEPRIEGYSGFDDDYGRLSRRAFSRARGVSRKLLPRLWV